MTASRKNPLRFLTVIIAALIIGACGGGSGSPPSVSPPPPPPPPPPPQTVAISVGDAQILEGNSGTSNLVFPVTLDNATTDDVTVDYATSDDSATAGDDYTSTSGVVTVVAGSVASEILVAVAGDTNPEGDERLTVVLTNTSANARLAVTIGTGVILEDDGAPQPLRGAELNDTGVTQCANGATNALACNTTSVGTDEYPEQDAEHGRDLTARTDIDGRAGFAFTKLDATGAPLADQAVDYSIEPWACVRDNVTGLTWEVKTDLDGPGDADWTYSWYASDRFGAATTVGDPGIGDCGSEGACDTERYAESVNRAVVCGFFDWRLPTRRELLSLVDYSVASGALIDSNYFPNTREAGYWTSTPSLLAGAWTVSMASGDSAAEWSFESLPVRLVRGGF